MRRPTGVGAAAAAVRAGAAIVAGLLLFWSFPPGHLWWAAPLGMALLIGLLTHRPTRARSGFGYAFLTGLGMFVPLLTWIDEMVGALPWLALSVALAVYYGLFGAVAVRVGRIRGGPVFVAATWTACEWARSSFPFGGFPWGRMAFSQPDGPFLALAHILGASGVSFAVALTGAGLAALVLRIPQVRGLRPTRRARGLAGPAAAAVVPVLCAAAVWPLVHAPHGGEPTATIAAIQGNVPRLNLDFSTQREAVLNNHLAETQRLAADIRAGRVARPDVVIWPENSSDIAPEQDPDAAARISAASLAVGAPILVGTVHFGTGAGVYYNSMIMWDGRGAGERHDKAILQPFGETMPMRSFFRVFSHYVDIANNFHKGSGDGVVHPGSGPRPGLPIGVATCYEVAFDRAFQTSVRAGAQVLTVPTNNATFGHTNMTYQQLGMSRVRAVELDREVVVAATTGVSAVITPDGGVARQTAMWTPAYLVTQAPLRSTRTPASRLAWAPDAAALIVALWGFAVAVGHDRRSARREGHPAATPADTAEEE
ncbi:apolipoprotein N-acyltransferase [Tsukamurella sp. 8F]|uniref:apolipoprotein N-acyltransferase n=1 Tax=unclassified Tsukamurella TaxID=2633480 RepID=UPI0023BA2DD9|nr:MULTISPECIES: apolipoprotein N-acyltransferase [unclassified Tsukamurella]MDF0530682.1 apolipoprotein N-acyltransferase [Tsukamurella sp. 8J]MDF0587883.1 apolipoprotein N-acyltransferase [Tsukamurella sp. 8F]